MRHDAVKRIALRALNRMDGEPMPQDVLRDSLRLSFPNLPVGDLDGAVKDLEDHGYILGSNVELVGIHWSLTTKGKLKAAELA